MKLFDFLEKKKITVLKWLAVLVVVSMGVSITSSWLGYWEISDLWKQESMMRSFDREIERAVGVGVETVKEWDGNIVARLKIEDKGEVVVWYGKEGLDGLDRVGEYQTTFECFENDSAGEKVSYVYSINLTLNRNGRFWKWVEVEVVEIGDIVLFYDEIAAGLARLPRRPATKVFSDEFGERLVREVVDEEFVVYPEGRESSVRCDVWLL